MLGLWGGTSGQHHQPRDPRQAKTLLSGPAGGTGPPPWGLGTTPWVGGGRISPRSQLRELSLLMGRRLWLLEMVGSFPRKLLAVAVYSSPSAKRTFPMGMGPGHSPFLLRAHSDLSMALLA